MSYKSFDEFSIEIIPPGRAIQLKKGCKSRHGKDRPVLFRESKAIKRLWRLKGEEKGNYLVELRSGIFVVYRKEKQLNKIKQKPKEQKYILKEKDISAKVKTLKAILYILGYISEEMTSNENYIRLTNVYDNEIKKAVKAFQKDHKLDITGNIDNSTWKTLLESLQKVTLTADIKTVPLYSELNHVFGDFRKKGWEQKNIVFCDLEEFRDCYEHVIIQKKPIFMCSSTKFGFFCHKKVKDIFFNIFNDIAKNNLADKIINIGDVYCVRQDSSGSKWSTHCWGIAIDINVGYDIDQSIIKIFEKNGFIWKGKYSKENNYHFQWAKD